MQNMCLLNFPHGLLINDSTSTHLACLQRYQGSEDTKLKNIQSSSQTITETMFSSTVIQSFHKAYDAVPSIIKLSLDAKEPTVQKIQKKRSYFDYVSPCSDLDLEDSKEIFLYDTVAHGDVSP